MITTMITRVRYCHDDAHHHNQCRDEMSRLCLQLVPFLGTSGAARVHSFAKTHPNHIRRSSPDILWLHLKMNRRLLNHFDVILTHSGPAVLYNCGSNYDTPVAKVIWARYSLVEEFESFRIHLWNVEEALIYHSYLWHWTNPNAV